MAFHDFVRKYTNFKFHKLVQRRYLGETQNTCVIVENAYRFFSELTEFCRTYYVNILVNYFLLEPATGILTKHGV